MDGPGRQYAKWLTQKQKYYKILYIYVEIKTVKRIQTE